MIVMNVTYKCKPNQRDSFLETIKAEGLDAACRAENGNIQYDYFKACADKNILLLLEKWEDADALSAHTQQPHFLKIGKIKEMFVEETIIEKYQSE